MQQLEETCWSTNSTCRRVFDSIRKGVATTDAPALTLGGNWHRQGMAISTSQRAFIAGNCSAIPGDVLVMKRRCWAHITAHQLRRRAVNQRKPREQDEQIEAAGQVDTRISLRPTPTRKKVSNRSGDLLAMMQHPAAYRNHSSGVAHGTAVASERAIQKRSAAAAIELESRVMIMCANMLRTSATLSKALQTPNGAAPVSFSAAPAR